MTDYNQKYDQLSSGQKSQINELTPELINYINNTDRAYASSRLINETLDQDYRPEQIGLAMSAISEIYETEIDYTSGETTRGQWMIHKIKDLPLEKLQKQILEP